MKLILISNLLPIGMGALNGLVNVLWILLVPAAASAMATFPPRVMPSNPRIINGTEAVAENTRHQVSIRMKSREVIFGTGHICGGSLIAPSVVLAAAHCFFDDYNMQFYDPRGYFVVMGTLDRFEPTNNTVSYEITKILYRDFNRPTFENDVALIFLNASVPDTNPAVKVIEMNRKVIAPGTMCQVTGWGVTESGISAEKLMTLDVPIIDRDTCSTNYGEGSILDGMICAGYMEGEKDACQGDSGGPMVYNGTLVGVVSFGDGCAQPGFPGVYADVRHYVDWIEESMKSGASSVTKGASITVLGVVLLCFLKQN